MIEKKKVVAFVLSMVAICSLVSCGNKEDAKTEKPNNEVVSQETEKADNQTENSIVGTWVVEKTEVYDGPMKEIAKQSLEYYYPVGSEHIFTDDGVFKNADEKIITKYKILSDNQISCVSVSNNETLIYDYELNGDNLVWYGNYTGAYAHLGHSNVTYFKRK